MLSIMAPFFGPAQTAAATCTFRGRISDTLGAAITRGFVLVHSDRWVKADQQLTLNENGEFEVQLKPGLYDFFVGSPGFLPIAKEIDLRSCKPVALKIKLNLDLAHLDD
jgi:hypothetical protein